MSTRPRNRTIRNLLILLLEELEEPGSIATTVTFRPQADFLILRLVEGKLLKPSLSEMPQGMRSMDRRVRSLIHDLTRECPNHERVVRCRDLLCEIRNRDFLRHGIKRSICRNVVGLAYAGGLIQEKKIDLVVPGVRI